MTGRKGDGDSAGTGWGANPHARLLKLAEAMDGAYKCTWLFKIGPGVNAVEIAHSVPASVWAQALMGLSVAASRRYMKMDGVTAG